MPKNSMSVKEMAGKLEESRSIFLMPCGYEKMVRESAMAMYVRMHKKACKICPKNAVPKIISTAMVADLGLTEFMGKNDPKLQSAAAKIAGTFA